jgi:hypothetical protein
MKKFLWLCIIWCWLISYSYACSWVHLSDEELRMDHELIVTATVDNIEQITNQLNNDNILSYPEPYMFYNFHVQKTFKWDQNIKTFIIPQERFSSCSDWYRTWTIYLLYLHQNPNKENWYSPYTPATQVWDYWDNIQPTFKPLRENKRHKAYKSTQTTILRIQQKTQVFFINIWDNIQYKFNFYKYTYGFY